MENTGKIYVFAGNRVDALTWANNNRLRPTEWEWVRNPETLRRVFRGQYVVLIGFETHPDCEYLRKLIALREMKLLGS